MKIYKIYAQCAINPHPITEITEQQADAEIRNTINEYVDEEISPSLYDELVSEDNFDIDSNILDITISNLIYEFWETNNFLDCGDYMIKKTDEDFYSLSRPNCCGYWHFTDEEIKKEFNQVKQHR